MAFVSDGVQLSDIWPPEAPDALRAKVERDVGTHGFSHVAAAGDGGPVMLLGQGQILVWFATGQVLDVDPRTVVVKGPPARQRAAWVPLGAHEPDDDPSADAGSTVFPVDQQLAKRVKTLRDRARRSAPPSDLPLPRPAAVGASTPEPRPPAPSPALQRAAATVASAPSTPTAPVVTVLAPIGYVRVPHDDVLRPALAAEGTCLPIGTDVVTEPAADGLLAARPAGEGLANSTMKANADAEPGAARTTEPGVRA